MLHFLLQDLDFFFFFIQLGLQQLSGLFQRRDIRSFLISDACETCLGLEDSLEAFVEGRGFFCADGSVSGDSGRDLWGRLVRQAAEAVAAGFWSEFDCARIVWSISTVSLLSDMFVYLFGSILKKKGAEKTCNWCYERLLLLSNHHGVCQKTSCRSIFFFDTTVRSPATRIIQ